MSCKKKGVPFTGSEEQKQALMQVIDALKNEKGALMPIMQKAQEIYGYLPIEVQTMIADGMGIPLEKVYGVAQPAMSKAQVRFMQSCRSF